MAQYKVLDPEQEIPCPYNKCEMIRAKRMPYHLMKCRRNHPCSEYASCPLNATHEVPKPELRYHIENCPDKPRIEQDLAYETLKSSGSSLFQGSTALPEYQKIIINSEEDWEIDIPLLPRIGVDPSFFAKLEGIHIDGLTRAEKKHMKAQYALPVEERRYVHFTNLEEKSSEKPVTAKEEVTEEKLRIPHKASQTYIPKPNIPKQQPSTVFTYSLSSVGVGRGQITSVSDPITKTDVAEQSVGRGTGGLGRGILRLGVDDSPTFLANRGQVGRGHQAGGMASKMFSSVGTGRGAAR
ncbi:uncharacterized protein LOC111137785 [Crassostrea virginica]